MQHLYNVGIIYWENVEQRNQAKHEGFIADYTRLRFETLYTGWVESTAHRRFVRAQGQAMSNPLIYDVALFKDGKLVARVRF